MNDDPRPVTVLLLAGARPKPSERGLGAGDVPKALLPVGGEPMLARVVRNLRGTAMVRSVRVMAQDAETMMARAGVEDEGVAAELSGLSIGASVSQALGDDWPYLIVTADHALLTPEIVREFLERSLATGCDLCVGVVARDVLEARFPGSKRTWLKFRGGAYTGANLFLLRNERARLAIDVWKEVEHERKKGRAIMGAFGPRLLIGTLFRLLTLPEAMAAAGRRLGCTAAAIELSDAEAGIDVDTEADLRQVEQILRDRQVA